MDLHPRPRTAQSPSRIASAVSSLRSWDHPHSSSLTSFAAKSLAASLAWGPLRRCRGQRISRRQCSAPTTWVSQSDRQSNQSRANFLSPSATITSISLGKVFKTVTTPERKRVRLTKLRLSKRSRRPRRSKSAHAVRSPISTADSIPLGIAELEKPGMPTPGLGLPLWLHQPQAKLGALDDSEHRGER